MKLVRRRLTRRFRKRFASAAGLVVLLLIAGIAGALEGIDRYSSGDRAFERAIAAVSSAGVGDITSFRVASTPGTEVVWDLPNLDHPRVDYWVRRFTTDKRGEFGRFLSRSGRYVPLISAKLEERGMPRDLVYLAMIESGFNPKAYSPAHASGIWQFISATGLRYGLDINRAVDERNDPIKATDAALDYLTYLHGRFGSWYLAAAGYNTGENRVGRIMREVTGSERGDESSYYRIWRRLPRETRDYVPLMVAAARIAKDAERYGFGEITFADPLEYDEVVVQPATPLAAVAEAAGTTVNELRLLNPHFKLNRTRNDMSSRVLVPPGSAEQYAANWPRIRRNAAAYAQAEAQTAARPRQYRVRQGDNLTVIARRHGVTIGQLRSANGLRGDRIRTGTTLRIPTG